VSAWSFLRLDQIASWFGGRLENPDTGRQSSGPSGGGEAIDVSDERALQLTTVYRCIALIAQTVACMPLGFFQRRQDGDRDDLDDDHYVVQLLKWKPNQAMTALEMRVALTMQLVGWGNGYGRVFYSGVGDRERPTSIVPMKPSLTTVYRIADGSLQYHYQTDSGIQVLSAKSVLHLKGLTLDGVVGLSPLSVGRQALSLSVAAERYSAGAFRNGGRPIGTLNFDKFLNAEQREQARKIYQAITSGADNGTNAWVLEGGVKYDAIAISPDDLQMLQSRQFQVSELARLFGVPSHLLNDSDKATSWGSGLEQLNLGFLQYTLTPYLKAWESAVSNRLLTSPDRRKVIVEHNVEGLLRADSAGRAAFYSTMAQNALMTRNEIRKKENLPGKPGGDELTLQSNMTLLRMLADMIASSMRGDPNAL
jgi:HK97 family phage portal protein